MAWILIASGCAFLASGIVLLKLRNKRSSSSAGRIATAVCLLLAVMWAAPASADHNEVTDAYNYWSPIPSNDVQVFLSSPRHPDSRDRGECGWEENINGRNWNRYAAADGSSNNLSLWGNTYEVAVSPNARDDKYEESVDRSNRWGADVHIVTHSNAIGGCPNSTQYLLVMFPSGSPKSTALTNELIEDLNPVVPGGSNKWDCDGLAECHAQAPHRVYVELFFHTNQQAVNWYQRGGLGHGVAWTEAWRYRLAIDNVLDYPRP
ncbi:hypothetical protein ACFWYW_00105 [Nonomuraea sp. NPDC059023]|uniref:hypothetical protein n=1 Tax=unclassified Nonomuraea TaxID=2593643 RepID=UPI0036C04830